jgi:hypothetical protein
MDPRISVLSMVESSKRWQSIKAVDPYFAAAGRLYILYLLDSCNS